MRKIKDVLRLKHEANLSNRQIARSLTLSASTVSHYVCLARAANLTWPLPDDMDDEKIKQLLQPYHKSYHAKRRCEEPCYATIHQELKRKGVTLQLLWEEQEKTFKNGGYSYPHYCRLYREWLTKQSLVMRQQHQAGEKCFVDYAGPTISIVDRETGETRNACIFVAVLGASHYVYAEATWTQSLPDWIASHCHAFEFFQGTTTFVVPDNLRAAVKKACYYEPEINATYAEWARHYNIAVLPARPYKARDKAKVENAVLIVERWILARLRHSTFFSLQELNEAIATLLESLNNRPFKKRPGSRHSIYLEIDKPVLNALPSTRYEFALFKKADVHIDYHVEYDSHYYSVPYALVKKTVEIRATSTTIEILYQSKRVASHPRSYFKSAHSTAPEHRPSSHQKYAEWSVSRFHTWANTIGPATAKVVEHILAAKRYPEQGYRSCFGLLTLTKRFDKTRLEAACLRAVNIGAFTRRSVLSILEKGLDRCACNATQEEASSASVGTHKNLRGADYFKRFH